MTELAQKQQGQLERKNDFISYMTNTIREQQITNGFDIPDNYSVSNALQSAFLILQDTKDKNDNPVLQSCTTNSIKNAVKDMIIQGLSPVKNQCYFIAYGNKLTLSRSYLGTIAMTKRVEGVKDVRGYAVYQDDELELGFDFVTGKTTLEKFKPSLTKDPTKIKGAIGLIIGENAILHVEYMDMAQIEHAWSMGQSQRTKAHNKFPDQMAIKTVINRACKLFVNTADDSDKIASLLNGSAEETDREFAQELSDNANVLELETEDFKEVESHEVDEETGEIKEQESTFTKEEQQSILNNAPF